MAETVRQAIERYAPNKRIARALMLGALFEGGSLGHGPFPSGDSGHSRGPFQENDLYHNYNHKKIQNPDYAVQYILPAYQAAYRKVPKELWHTNPELAAERVAFLAEHPKYDYYRTYGASGVHARWEQVTGKVGKLAHEPAFKLTASGAPITGDSGVGIGTWIGANIALVIVVVVLIVVLKK